MQLTCQDAIFKTTRYTTQRDRTRYTKLRIYHEELGETLAKILGLRDPGLQVHSFQVASFATRLARRLRCTQEQVDLVWRGSLLHDIGKLAIPQDLLSTPARLTALQFEIIKTHTMIGAALLQECPEYQDLIPMVRHHHEFFNGKGYPDQLAGEQIEPEARIVAVADAVDVMTSYRVYCTAFPIKKVIAELEHCAGTQFDPDVVRAATSILIEREKQAL
jgi:putative nucleotidyltransferase with HDIG domain